MSASPLTSVEILSLCHYNCKDTLLTHETLTSEPFHSSRDAAQICLKIQASTYSNTRMLERFTLLLLYRGFLFSCFTATIFKPHISD